jgi:hypothetical protein
LDRFNSQFFVVGLHEETVTVRGGTWVGVVGVVGVWAVDDG